MATDTATYPVGSAEGLRQSQLAIRAQVMLAAARLWPLLDKNDLPGTFPGWVGAMAALVNNYRAQSALAAARSYSALRAVALGSPTPADLPQLAPAASVDWLTRAFGYAGPGMLNRDTARPGTALSTTLGTAGRIAVDGGRQTIADTVAHDRAAVGWYRVTDGDPCAFCALLASRGVVYKQDTAGFQAHNDCGCTAAPAFSHDQQLPELSEVADRVYREHGHGSLAGFRRAWAEHQQAKTA